MQKVDKYVIQNWNRRNIIRVIRSNGPINRARIAGMTGLSVPTVMNIVDGFLCAGLIRKAGKGESTGGKPPALLSFVPDYRHIIGVDIGATSTTVILMNLGAEIKCRLTEPTPVQQGFPAVLQTVLRLVDGVLLQSGISVDRILGIGVGAPGLLSPETGAVRFSPDLGWRDVDLLTPLQGRYHCPILLDNVSRAMAMGELWFGLGQDIRDFLCVNLGYGIGSAVVIDHKLYYGTAGLAGELGHMTVDRDGPLCDCGNRGCLEAISSANAISKRARSAIENGVSSHILALADGDPALIEARTVFAAAAQGDALADSVIHQAIEHLGIALAGVINLLAPQRIILEGGMSRAGDALLLPLREVIDRHTLPLHSGSVQVCISPLGENAAAIGAASFLFHQLVEQGGVIRHPSVSIRNP